MNRDPSPPLPGLPDWPAMVAPPLPRPVAEGEVLMTDTMMATVDATAGGDPIAVTAGYGLPEDPADHVAQLVEVEALARFAEIRRVALVADLVEAAPPVDQEIRRPLGGEGTPPVPEFLPLEIGGALGMPAERARMFLADAINLKWRHPRLWNRMVHGEMPVWRCLAVARRCQLLPLLQALRVDEHVGDHLPRVSWARAQRLLEGAIAAADPVAAAERERAAANRRFLGVAPRPGATGAMQVFGVLDVGDAHQLDLTLSRMAADLAADGDTDDLDTRRARALGLLARGGRPGQTPVVHLYVHTTDRAEIARVEGHGPLAHGPLADLLTGCRVRLTRVIDHAESVPVDAYEMPEAMREQVIAAQPVEVAPYGSLSARRADMDHTVPYAQGGRTSAHEMGPLSRTAHRAKHRGGYRLSQPMPGLWHWRTPRGQEFLVTNRGTFRVRT